MNNKSAGVILDITNTPNYVPDGKGEIDVCQGVKDMIYEESIPPLIKLFRDNSLSIETAATKANMKVEQFKEAMEKAPLQAV